MAAFYASPIAPVGKCFPPEIGGFRRGAEFLKIIFPSIFFVSLGVVADLNALTRDILPFVVILTLVAIATKVVGCALPAPLSGICREDALIVGFIMAPPGRSGHDRWPDRGLNKGISTREYSSPSS